MALFYVLLMFIAPIVVGLGLAFAQLGFYRLLRRPADVTPSFPILFGRGVLAVFVLAAVLALVTRVGQAGLEAGGP